MPDRSSDSTDAGGAQSHPTPRRPEPGDAPRDDAGTPIERIERYVVLEFADEHSALDFADAFAGAADTGSGLAPLADVGRAVIWAETLTHRDAADGSVRLYVSPAVVRFLSRELGHLQRARYRRIGEIPRSALPPHRRLLLGDERDWAE